MCALRDTTIHDMSTAPAPARAWYDTVTETIAVRGWSVAQLAQRSGVARTTIYGWRDNPRKPQSKSVNAVADALGIPRERALRLAGVIAAAPEAADRSPPTLLDGAVGHEDADLVRRALHQVYPDQAEEILAGIERKLRRRAATSGGG